MKGKDTKKKRNEGNQKKSSENDEENVEKEKEKDYKKAVCFFCCFILDYNFLNRLVKISWKGKWIL
jgi:hypothetical protein